jgi:hypothetical protein
MKKALISVFVLLVLSSFAHADLNIELLGIIEGENNQDCFGENVANLGDINGDGLEDFAIAAPEYPAGEDSGRVYIYLGDEQFDLSVDAILDNPGQVKWFGLGLSGLSDINGDGCDEFLIGAHVGVFLYYGANPLDLEPDLLFKESLYYFGLRIASGDVDNDGFSDFAVAGGGDDTAYVYLGSEEMDTIPDFVLCGKALGMDGIAVGDVNGDGYDDIAAAEYQDSLYLFFGRDSLHSDRDLAFAQYGGDPAIGDVNGDDYEDLICYYHLYYGSAEMDTITDVWLRKARGVASVGNLNRDRYGDILAKSYGVFVPSRANIYLGDTEVDTIVDWWWEENMWDNFGADLDCVDINADGVDEFLVSSTMWPNERRRGRVHVFAGDTAATSVEDAPGALPDEVSLYQNYPNPFNSSTTIRFSVSSGLPVEVSLKVHDVQGRLVKELFAKPAIPGTNRVLWDGTNDRGERVSSGLYFISLESAGLKQNRKAVFIR